MKDLIVTCGTLKEEVNIVLKKLDYTYDIVTLEAELHNYPDRLRDTLQQTINDNTMYKNILLVYGCCGNALIGLKSVESNLIIPKTDDCISMMLSNNDNYTEIRKQTYFLTKAWIEGTKNLFKEMEHLEKRYGKERGSYVMHQMLKNYKYLMLIDNGAYDINEYLPEADKFSKELDLELIVEKGSLDVLEDLLSRKWENNFIVVKKGNTIKLSDFYK